MAENAISAVRTLLPIMFTAVHAGLLHSLAKGQVRREETTAGAPGRGV